MTISLPGATKIGFGKLFGRDKSKKTTVAPQKTLTPQEVARLFKKDKALAEPKPGKLNETEKQDRAALGGLRRALYARD